MSTWIRPMLIPLVVQGARKCERVALLAHRQLNDALLVRGAMESGLYVALTALSRSEPQIPLCTDENAELLVRGVPVGDGENFRLTWVMKDEGGEIIGQGKMDSVDKAGDEEEGKVNGESEGS